MREDGQRFNERLVLTGLGLLAAALIGWLGTLVGLAWATDPDVVEDLTGPWSAAGVTPLGGSATVAVPPQQTLVALLVGTDLRSIAGTTTAECSARTGGRPIPLGWPVLLDFAVTGLLAGEREAVAIAGWTNTGAAAVTVDITCDTADSTVEGFVAVPSTTAAIARDPWFQPWGWVALGAVGAAIAVGGVVRLPGVE